MQLAVDNANAAVAVHVHGCQRTPHADQVAVAEIGGAAAFHGHILAQGAITGHVLGIGYGGVNAADVIDLADALDILVAQAALQGGTADGNAYLASTQLGKLAGDLVGGALHGGDQRDDGCHADDNAQRGEEGAHLVALDVLPGHPQAFLKHPQPPPL